MRPQFVYLDLGNVLLYFDHGLAVRSMARIANVHPDRLREVVFDGDLQIRYETGLISSEEFIDQISQKLDKPLNTNAMILAAADIFIPNAQMLPVLQSLRRTGIPLGLLSNTCDAHWKWIVELQYPQVTDWFSKTILSFEVGCMKPHPDIYRIATEIAACAPDKIFFADDREDNVQGAREAGWQAEVFTSADRLMSQIASWDIE